MLNMVALYNHIYIQLILLTLVHLAYTVFHVVSKPYKRNILNLFNIILDCMIVLIIAAKIHSYYYLMSIINTLTIPQVIQYF